jgi:hypothetical protein
MSEARVDGSTSGAIRRETDGAAALGAADWLSLAAAPSFAIMALLTADHGSPADIRCSAAHEGSPLSGMTLMYRLMSVFHAAPWLKLIASRRSAGLRRSASGE